MSIENEENIRKVDTVDADIMTRDPINDVITKPRFNVMSVEKTSAPSGMTGDNWFEYVIGQGTSEIQGLKVGTLAGVTEHANSVADDLNDRLNSKKTGYTQSQNKKTPPKPPS